MRPPLKIRLRGRQRSRLQRMFDETSCPRTRIRVQSVLLADAERTVPDIAAITQQSDDTVRYWLHRFIAQGCDGLFEGRHSGRPPTITPREEAFLLMCLSHSPREFGFERSHWTTVLLAEAVSRLFQRTVSDECIRQHLVTLDIVCRRPTWTVKHLAQAQPGYAQKKAQLQGCYDIRQPAPMSTLKMKPN
jgi:transposase